MIRLLLFLLILALPARAEQVVAGLSQNRVAITADFDGSEILIFGAVKREAPAPDNPLGVIITVAGPTEKVTVFRKARRMGIWVNTDRIVIDAAPAFYAVATSAPLSQILSYEADVAAEISVPRAVRSVALPENAVMNAEFTDALIRLRSEAELFQLLDGQVQVSEGTLFNTAIALPANITAGEYTAHIFLTRQGQIVDAFSTELEVNKVGLERWLYTMAYDQPLLYALLSLAIAAVAGWGASEVFRLLRS